MKSRTFVVVIGLVVSILLSSMVDAALMKIKRPGKSAEITRLADLRTKKWINSPIRDVPSKRKIIENKRRQARLGLVGAEQDVLRLCAIRVEFESVPDPAKISGNAGRFDLEDRRGVVPIDPSPHDRKYFSKHMEAVANYYDAMSYGQLEIQWEVFPMDNDSAYVLPSVDKYNPEAGIYTWTWENLELFFRDAIKAADDDPEIAFGDFDGFVVFHAGSDWQNDLFGDTPYDLPSFFISLAGSIAVDDSTYFVVDGSVIPETTTQDGYFNGINGVLAHEIGHQLGLPDFYDTFSGLSVVGYWCLMDFGSGVGVVLEDTLAQESYYVTGIVPGSLSAWNKAYLGWSIPDTAGGSGTFNLSATELQTGAPNRDLLFIPINSYEYYLIENRQTDLDGDGIGYLLGDPSEDSTGVILGPVNENRELNYEYDFALPGSGLLVWHIDRLMVEFGNPFDMINAFPERRGIRIEEADGVPDLGDYNSFYFLGSPFDPFSQGVNDRFADDTYPATISNTGCHSHIVIDQISESANSMSLRVSHGWGKTGFPVALGDSMRFGVPSLLVADTDGDGREEMQAAIKRAGWDDSLGVVYLRSEVHCLEVDETGALISPSVWPRRLYGSDPTELAGIDFDGDGYLESVVGDETGRLYAFSADGTAYFETSDSLGCFCRVDGTVNGMPVAFDLDGDGSEELLVGTSSGLLVLSGKVGVSSDTVFTALPARAVSQPVVFDYTDFIDGIDIVAYAQGEILVVSADGTSDLVFSVSCSQEPAEVYLAGADIDREPGEDQELILIARDGLVLVLDAGGGMLHGWGGRVCEQVVCPPALADLNSDRYLEILLNDEDYNTRALLRTGTRLDGWPKRSHGCTLPEWDRDFYPPDTTIPFPSPVIADLDCDNMLNVIQGTRFECIAGWVPSGARTEGFPVTLGGGCSAASMGDIDGDGKLELVAGGGDGYLYGVTHPAADAGGCRSPWRTPCFSRSRNCVYPVELMPQPPEPGDILLVKDSFHGFPNPVFSDVVTFTLQTEIGGTGNIEIFDVSGVKVKSIRFKAEPPENDRQVDISDLANGLYVCRLNLKGNGESANESFKLAIKR